MAEGGDGILVGGGLVWIVVKLWCFMLMASWWKVQTRRLPRRAVRSIEQAHAADYYLSRPSFVHTTHDLIFTDHPNLLCH
jgi:hypothetical protein